MEGLQPFLGPNLIITSMIPYFIATALQDTDLQLGLSIATGFAGCHVILGALLIIVQARHVYPSIVGELLMLVIYPVLLGTSFASDDARTKIELYYNFIVNSTIVGICAISMLVTYPACIQHCQELVPWIYHSHQDVIIAGNWCTGVLASSFTITCLLYIVPVARGVATEHSNALNLVFRIILPMILNAAAVLFVRFWPNVLLSHLRNLPVMYDIKQSQIPSSILFRPRVLDQAMFNIPPKSPDLWTGNPLSPASWSSPKDSRSNPPHLQQQQQQNPQQNLQYPQYQMHPATLYPHSNGVHGDLQMGNRAPNAGGAAPSHVVEPWGNVQNPPMLLVEAIPVTPIPSSFQQGWGHAGQGPGQEQGPKRGGVVPFPPSMPPMHHPYRPPTLPVPSKNLQHQIQQFDPYSYPSQR